MDKAKNIVGKGFKGTIVEDPSLEPYFIIQDQIGSFLVNIKKEKNGKTVFSTLSYPSSFMECLDTVAKYKFLGGNKTEFASIRDYVDTWRSVSRNILDAYKKWEIQKI